MKHNHIVYTLELHLFCVDLLIYIYISDITDIEMILHNTDSVFKYMLWKVPSAVNAAKFNGK